MREAPRGQSRIVKDVQTAPSQETDPGRGRRGTGLAIPLRPRRRERLPPRRFPSGGQPMSLILRFLRLLRLPRLLRRRAARLAIPAALLLAALPAAGCG